MTSDIGDLKGFGVDLMRAVANALDVNVEFKNDSFLCSSGLFTPWHC